MLVLVQEMQEKQEIQESCKVVIHGRTAAELNCAQILVQLFGTFNLFPYLCIIVSQSIRGRRAVLLYEKDVFERLSL